MKQRAVGVAAVNDQRAIGRLWQFESQGRGALSFTPQDDNDDDDDDEIITARTTILPRTRPHLIVLPIQCNSNQFHRNTSHSYRYHWPLIYFKFLIRMQQVRPENPI